jgi:hypothetical protein
MPYARTLLLPLLVAFTAYPTRSETTLTGDHVIEAGASDTGSLTLEGNLHIEGNASDQGTTDTGLVAMQFSYEENGTTYRYTVMAKRDAVEYLWKQNSVGIAKTKMKLGADNALTLFDDAGVAKITLKPAEGEIVIGGGSGAGGVRLSDGTLLQGAHSLRSTALYNAAGQVAAQVGSDGKITFNNGVAFGNDPAATLNASKTAYLSEVLGNLGYQENPVAPTSVGLIPITGSASISAIRRMGDHWYVAGSYNSPRATVGGAVIDYSYAMGGFVAKVDGGGVAQWVTSIATDQPAWIRSLAVDSSGNVAVAGHFQGSTLNLAANISSAGPASDGILVTLNSGGAVQWSKAIGGTSHDYANSVAIDGAGNVVVAGTFSGTTTTLATNVAAAGYNDGLIVKFNSSGVLQWRQAVGGVGASIQLNAVAVDGSGNVAAAGVFNGSTTNLAANVTSAGSDDGLILKFNNGGTLQWRQPVGGVGNGDKLSSVAMDGSGNVVVAGAFTGSTTNLVSNATSAGGSDGLVLKFNGGGTLQWRQPVGGAGEDAMNSVAIDGAGNVVAAGNIGGTTTNLGACNVTFAGGYSDGLIVKWDGGGTPVQSVRVGDSGYQTIGGVTLGGGDVAVLGYHDLSTTGGLSIGNMRVARSFTAFWPALTLVTPTPNTPAPLTWSGSSVTGNGVALGNGAYASGNNSAAFGGGSSTGPNSFASGSGFAQGAAATALGGGTASGEGAFASGAGGAFGEYAVAFGTSHAQGFAAVAFGSDSGANGLGAIAMGGYSSAFGDGAVALGFSSGASGTGATALGYQNYAMADGATAFGNESQASGRFSTAIGMRANAQALGSVSLGRNNVAQGDSSAWVETDDLIVVGNGEDYGTSRNALVVHKNADTRVGGRLDVKGGIRTAPMGDIGMGGFTSGPNPATLNDGLRYSGE